MESKETRIPILLENSANGVKISLGEVSRIIDAKTAYEIKVHLSEWLEYYEHWAYYAKCYKGYSIEKINLELDQDENQWSEDDDCVYSVGGSFAMFLGALSENGIFEDNGKAAKIIKKDWAIEFPNWKDELDFDPETSYCYVYTKNRDVAREFSWWTYNKYIKESLKEFNV